MKQDKIQHIVVAAALTALVGLPAYFGSWSDCAQSYSLFSGLWATVGCGTLLAVCKEWCDNNYSFGKWDVKDFLATCLGAALVVLFILGLHYGRG